jgi:hypothetical protein
LASITRDLDVVWDGSEELELNFPSILGRERGAEKNIQTLFKRDSRRGRLSIVQAGRTRGLPIHSGLKKMVIALDLASND